MFSPEGTDGRLASVGRATRSRTRPTTDYRDHHATIFVAPEVAGPIEAVRRSWDPSMAAWIAAHVTVAYPQLRPPFHGMTYPPHVTLVHPQTSCRGREFWDSGCYQRQDQRFTVEEVAITAFDGVEWVVLMPCTLGSGDRDESRGHRLTTRSGRPRPRDVRPAR